MEHCLTKELWASTLASVALRFLGWISMLSQKIRAEMKEAAEKVQPVTVETGARETQARSTQLSSHLGTNGERTSLGNAEITRRKRCSQWVRSLSADCGSVRAEVSDAFSGSCAGRAPSHVSLRLVSVARGSPDWGARRGKEHQCSWRVTALVCLCRHPDLWSTACCEAAFYTFRRRRL